MTNILPEEVIKVHEKTLRLLDGTNEQLINVQEMLRKSVVRLSIAARRDDDQLDEVLENIKSSVKNKIDLDELEAHLDKLLVLINHAENEGEYSPGISDNAPEEKFDKVKSFANKLSESLNQEFIIKEDADVSIMLEQLADDIVKHVGNLNSDELDGSPGNSSVNNNSTEYLKNVLIEMLDNLMLPQGIQQERQSVYRELDSSIDEDHQRKVVVEDVSELINKSIETILIEKDELQVFIRKTTGQLEEIEEYVRKSRQDSIDTVSESSMLKDSVEANVDIIQSTVGDAEEINQLKSDVQDHLAEIRKSVEEYQLAETERENMSKQGYAHIIGELTRTQKETLMLKEQLHESKQKMLRDPLTGLPNRMAFDERITLEINRCKRNNENICIAMWDLDHFKKVNDTYGHDAGDRVLKLLAKIISTRVRKVDMFSRIGGEEFVLLMPDTSLENALNLNNQLRDSLANSGFHYDGAPCPITASVGIARIEEYDNSESVMRKADEALYKSKREGRNRCTIYTPEV